MCDVFQLPVFKSQYFRSCNSLEAVTNPPLPLFNCLACYSTVMADRYFFEEFLFPAGFNVELRSRTDRSIELFGYE